MPTVEQEAARDLVRAREDVRGDLMRARHRLLEAAAATRDRLYRRPALDRRSTTSGCGGQRFDLPGRQLAFDAAYETMLLTVQRRDRLDERDHRDGGDSEYTDLVRRLGCLRGISTLTGFGLAVEIGDWHRFTGIEHRRLPRPGAHRTLLRPVPVARLDHQDRQQPRPPAAGRGRLAPPQDLPPSRPDHADPWELALARGPGPRPRREPAGCTSAGRPSPPAGRSPSSPTSPSPASSPAGPGRWPCSNSTPQPRCPSPIRSQREGRPAIHLWTTAHDHEGGHVRS